MEELIDSDDIVNPTGTFSRVAISLVRIPARKGQPCTSLLARRDYLRLCECLRRISRSFPLVVPSRKRKCFNLERVGFWRKGTCNDYATK
jgi:hypothetical protein